MVGSHHHQFLRKAGLWFRKEGHEIEAGVKKVVNTVYNDVKSVVHWGGTEADNVINSGTHVVDGKS